MWVERIEYKLTPAFLSVGGASVQYTLVLIPFTMQCETHMFWSKYQNITALKPSFIPGMCIICTSYLREFLRITRRFSTNTVAPGFFRWLNCFLSWCSWVWLCAFGVVEKCVLETNTCLARTNMMSYGTWSNDLAQVCRSISTVMCIWSIQGPNMMNLFD